VPDEGTTPLLPWQDPGVDLRALIDRYNDAWNAHDLDAICSMHAPGMVFENHTAAERVEGDAVRDHIAAIFRNTPDLRFTGRRLYVGKDLVVSEWTAHATRDGRAVEWDGVDVFPFRDGLIARKDVYSASHRPRAV
jgi:ketosteroid isomerase-like protein